MAILNHINLSVSDVPELARFFELGFGFRTVAERGNGNFRILTNEDSFILALMHDKNARENSYPANFHVGFLLGSEREVHEHRARLAAAGFDPPAPQPIHRGGGEAFGFYCHAPGGVMVEVSARQV